MNDPVILEHLGVAIIQESDGNRKVLVEADSEVKVKDILLIIDGLCKFAMAKISMEVSVDESTKN